MPTRVKNEAWLSVQLIGGQAFSYNEVTSMPQADYDAVQEFVAELYSRFVDYADWERVILEAQGYCSAMEHSHDESRVCAAGMRASLLCYDRPFYGEREGHYGWDEARMPVSDRPPRGWFLPKDLVPMMSAWVRARRKSIKEHDDEN